MAQIEPIIPFILSWEGGFSNNSNDLGGATFKGVTLKTYTYYCKLKKLPTPSVEDLKMINTEVFTDILRTLFWNKALADEINSQAVANIITDWLWCSGIYAIKETQQTLGVTADGIMGGHTIAAINNSDSKELFEQIKSRRIAFLNRIVERNHTQNIFLKGWLRRVNSITYENISLNE